MTNLTDLLKDSLKRLFKELDFTQSERSASQVILYTDKSTIGSPDNKYSVGLDAVLERTDIDTNGGDILGFNDFVQYRSLHQHRSHQDSFDVSAQWSPNSYAFTPEGVSTLGYSPWYYRPIYKGAGSVDREARLSHTYADRRTPLRGSGPSVGPYSQVDHFKSAFWVSLAASGSPTLQNKSVAVDLDKSYFIACQHYDTSARPVDVQVLGSDALTSSYSDSGWANINAPDYSAFTRVGFNIESSGPAAYRVVIDIDATGLSSGSYRHYLVCAGADYVPSYSGPVGSFTGPVLSKVGILRFIDDTYAKTIVFPRKYDSYDIRGVHNSNVNRVAVEPGTLPGDLVLLIGQKKASENGLYVVSTGSWLNVDDFATDNFYFLRSTAFGMTGSEILFGPGGRVFDAPPPNMKVVATRPDSSLPKYVPQSVNGYKTINSLRATGSVYGDFGIGHVTYDPYASKSIGVSHLEDSGRSVEVRAPVMYVTSYSAVLGDALDVPVMHPGDILTIVGNFGTPIVGEELVLASSPANFAIVEVLYSTAAKINGYAQIIVKKICGSPSTARLGVMRDFTVFGDLEVTQNEYYSVLETYQSHVTKPLRELKSWLVKSFDESSNIKRALVLNNTLSRKETQSLFTDEGLFDLFAKNLGYITDPSYLEGVDFFGHIKGFSSSAVQGAKASPDMVFLEDDLQFGDYRYEFVRQTESNRGPRRFIDNSVGETGVSEGEFEFNALDIESIGGESTNAYSAKFPYSTGSNVIRKSVGSSDRVLLRDQYGDTYTANEGFAFDQSADVEGLYTSAITKGPAHGSSIYQPSDGLISAYSGPLASGLILTDGLTLQAMLRSPVTAHANHSTKTTVYAQAPGGSDLIFAGKALFIPLPSIDLDRSLKSAVIYARAQGSLSSNGFLRASVVDLSVFFETNDANDILVYASSGVVPVGHVGDSYVPLAFSITEDAHWQTRSAFGQRLFLMVEKAGDFSPGRLMIKCANASGPLMYQEFSGTRANTGLRPSAVLSSVTGSSVYRLHQYLGNELTMVTSVSGPSTFSVAYVRYPYVENVKAVSFNDPVDFVNVRLTSLGTVTGPPLLSLSTAYGTDTYSFAMYALGTGSKNIVFGATGPSVRQSPKGYHLLFAAEPLVNDGLSTAYIELERNFVYDTMMTPSLDVYTTNQSLRGALQASSDDSSVLTEAKESVFGARGYLRSAGHGAVRRCDLWLDSRTHTLVTPHAFSTGPVTFMGLNTNKNIDLILGNNNEHLYIRRLIDFTYGIAAYSYEGDTNGILGDMSKLAPVIASPMSTSVFSGAVFTGSLMNTNLFLNFLAPPGMASIRVSTDPNNLVKITNVTTSSFTGPHSGPNVELFSSFASGSPNNVIVTLFGASDIHWAQVSYNNGTYHTFDVASGSMFPEASRSAHIVHPAGMSVIDGQISDEGDPPKFMIKRYTR